MSKKAEVKKKIIAWADRRLPSDRSRRAIIHVLSGLHFLLMMVCFVLMWEMGYKQTLVGWYPYLGDLAIVAGYCVLFSSLFKVYHGLYVGRSRISELFVSQGLTYVICAAVFYVVYFFYYRNFFNPLPLIGIVAVQTVLSGVWCVFMTNLYFMLFRPARTVVFYSRDGQLDKLYGMKHFANHYQVLKTVNIREYDMNRVPEDAADAEVVFCCSNSHHFRDAVFYHCMARGIRCYYTPDVSDLLFDNSVFDQYFDLPVFTVNLGGGNGFYLGIKRLMDIVLSFLGIVVLSPLLLITAVVIRLYDGGPAIYRQIRLTKDGREFEIYKFRSMVTDAEKDGVARLSYENDDRITPVGKVIRRFRIDEFPQLFNILKGDMSIVGPRPERPEIAAEYARAYPAFPLRLRVKAGLTGLAQVYGRYNTEPIDKLKMDLIYINRMSLQTDLLMIFLTVKALFKKESTEAVAESQVNALADAGKEEPAEAPAAAEADGGTPETAEEAPADAGTEETGEDRGTGEAPEAAEEAPAGAGWPVPDDTVSYEVAELWAGRPAETGEDGDDLDSDPRT